MDKQALAYRIAKEMMYDQDPFSKRLGIDIVELGPGSCTLKLTVRKNMVNGFNIAHGGIAYSLADSALAFASNSHGKQAVSIETSITHCKVAYIGDELTAIATEENINNKIGTYHVKIFNQNDEIVALFKGTVFRRNIDWIVE